MSGGIIFSDEMRAEQMGERITRDEWEQQFPSEWGETKAMDEIKMDIKPERYQPMAVSSGIKLMDEEIKIEKGIPIPPRRRKYRFREMEVGDSFFIPGRAALSMSGVIGYHNKNGKHFIPRDHDENGRPYGGTRIWRDK